MLVRYLLYMIIVLPTAIINAQTPTQNLEKYWAYRQRLTGTADKAGFVDIGLGQGQSIPALERFPHTDCATDWYMQHHSCSPHEGTGRLHWSDATLYLGHYMAILALEYANLYRANQSTQVVAQELWYALEAFERLDSLAEVTLGLEGKKDGFFLRDDIAATFYLDNDSSTERRFGKDKFTFDCTSSAYSCGEPRVEDGVFISQDQVTGLLVGFMTINQLIADHRYQPNLPTFGEKVSLNMHRIASYMMRYNWQLKGPNGTDIPNKWGGNAIGLSYPIGKIANHITQQKYGENYLGNGAKLLGKPIYKLLHASLAWQSEINRGLAMATFSLLENTPATLLARKAIKEQLIIYPLLHAVLFRKPLSDKIEQHLFEDLLHTAPPEGPCFNSPDCMAPDGWKSYDRWIHPDFVNGNPHGIHSESPGLDYMLLYNLYHYYYYTDLPAYYAPDNVLDYSLPAWQY